MRATYVNGPLATVTCTTPESTVSLASRNSRLNTVRTQNPSTASTIAQVGVFWVEIHWSWDTHWDPRSGQPPTGVWTIVVVTVISPIAVSGCSTPTGTSPPVETGYWAPLTGCGGYGPGIPLTGIGAVTGIGGPLAGVP